MQLTYLECLGICICIAGVSPAYYSRQDGGDTVPPKAVKFLGSLLYLL